MKLIQLPTQAFEEKIAQEIEENPALESGKENDDDFESDNQEDYDDSGTETIETDINIDDYLSDDEMPSYKLQSNNYSSDDDEKNIPFASGTSFNQFLISQLNTLPLNEKEHQIIEFLHFSAQDYFSTNLLYKCRCNLGPYLFQTKCH